MTTDNELLPTVWTIEFIDRDVVHITHPSKESARILAQAQRINEGKLYTIRSQWERKWYDV